MRKLAAVVAATSVVLLWVGTVAPSPGAWAAESRIGPEAQWAAPVDAIAEIHRECDAVAGPAFAFDFDTTERFLGRRLIVVRAGNGGDGAEAGSKIGGAASLSPRLEVEVGKDFSITLASNRTTGYRWQLVMPLNEQIVKLVGSEYVAPTASRPGAGGEEVWTFRAVGPGKTEIALQYVRPWETGVAPAETARYVVVVR